jgi:predicted TIM-barrel fold metal-dependent hydrolase
MSLPYELVDAWVNPNLGAPADPRYDVGYLFPELAERWRRGTSLSQLIEEMDEAGVGRAVLCAGYGGIPDGPDVDWVIDATERHPERFVGSIAVDPRRGMSAVKTLERMVRDHGFRMARMIGFEIGLPYDHRAYYPVYAKCAELGVPLGLNVGIPGPLIAGAVQHPLPLDEICAFFPELTIVMQHGGEPWVDLCVKLLLKWPNLHYMSSAFAPRRIPPQILHLANSRAPQKVMWATDYPLLTFARCVEEIEQMPFKDEERRRQFARDNALSLFGLALDG